MTQQNTFSTSTLHNQGAAKNGSTAWWAGLSSPPPPMKEGGKMCTWLNHWFCRDGPDENNNLRLSLYHLMWHAAQWVGLKFRIMEVMPYWPILQINEVLISKNLRAVVLCWVINYFSFLVLYYSYQFSCRLENKLNFSSGNRKTTNQEANIWWYDILEGVNKTIGYFQQGLKKWYSCLCCIYTCFPLFLSRILGLSIWYNRTAITVKEVVNQKTEEC